MFLLSGADASVNAAGIFAVKNMLKDARRLAKSLPQAKKAAIEAMCKEIDDLAKELAELQAYGQVSMLLVFVFVLGVVEECECV